MSGINIVGTWNEKITLFLTTKVYKYIFFSMKTNSLKKVDFSVSGRKIQKKPVQSYLHKSRTLFGQFWKKSSKISTILYSIDID